MMKIRILTIVAALSAASALKPMAYGAYCTETVDGITWSYTIKNGEATVGTGNAWEAAIPNATVGAISVPSTLENCPVTEIGNCAFARCRKLTSVTIPSNVKVIQRNAVSDSDGLRNMKIPSSVTNIWAGALSFVVEQRSDDVLC